MSIGSSVWIDQELCTGCGMCAEVCPVGAAQVAGQKAVVDATLCTGCGACIEACPEGAIQYVVEVEVVPIEPPSVPTRPVARTSTDLAALPGMAARTPLFKAAAEVLLHVVNRWLTGGSRTRETPLEHKQAAAGSATRKEAQDGSRHRARHRRQGH